MREEGYIDEVSLVSVRTFLAADASAQSLTLSVEDTTDFEEDGGVLRLGGVPIDYASVDYDTDIITLVAPLEVAAFTEDEVTVLPEAYYKEAAVITSEDDEPVTAVVHHTLIDRLPEGIREDDMEAVAIELIGDTWYVVDILGQVPRVDGSYLEPDTIGFDALAPDVIDGIQSGGIDTSAGPTAPVDPSEGDLWLDTSGSVNVLKQRVDGAWLTVSDPNVQAALEAAQAAADLADSKMRIHYAPEPPTGLTAADEGDLWFDTNDGNHPYQYNSTTQAWVSVRDGLSVQANAVANAAATTANGKNKVIFNTVAPPASTTGFVQGDLYYQRDGTTGLIVATWEFTQGQWVRRYFTDAILNSLTVGKLTSGVISATDIVLGTNGAIRSANYSTNATGWRLGNGALEMNEGTLRGVAVYGALLSTGMPGSTGNRVTVQNDGTNGGLIRFYSGIGGLSDPGTIQAVIEQDSVGADVSALYIDSGTTDFDSDTAGIRLVSGVDDGKSLAEIESYYFDVHGLASFYNRAHATNGLTVSGASLALNNVPISNPNGPVSFSVLNGALTLGGGSNISARLGTNFSGTAAGAALVFRPGMLIAARQDMNATAASASNTVNMYADGFFDAGLIGGGTTGANIGNGGRIVRATSSRKYKSNIRPLGLTQASKALDLEAVSFTLRNESDMGERRPRYPGFIAEQAHEAGMDYWVNYNTAGEPDGFRYPELTAAHNVLIKDLYSKHETQSAEIEALTSKNAELEQRLATLEVVRA